MQNLKYTFTMLVGESKMSVNYKNSTSLRITEARKIIAQSIAVEITTQTGTPVRTSEVLNFVIDQNLKPTIVEDYIKYNKLPIVKRRGALNNET